MNISKKLKKFKDGKEIAASTYDFHELMSYLETPDLENMHRHFLHIFLFHLWNRDIGWMTNSYLGKITGREMSSYSRQGLQKLCDLGYLKRKLEGGENSGTAYIYAVGENPAYWAAIEAFNSAQKPKVRFDPTTFESNEVQ